MWRLYLYDSEVRSNPLKVIADAVNYWVAVFPVALNVETSPLHLTMESLRRSTSNLVTKRQDYFKLLKLKKWNPNGNLSKFQSHTCPVSTYSK